MRYTGRDFAVGLKQQLTVGYSAARIAQWAHGEYLKFGRDMTTNLNPIIMRVIAMDEGSEFELTELELSNLADELLKDGLCSSADQ